MGTLYLGSQEICPIVTVGSQPINNQDKTITQNGTYTADTGYTGLGEVTVNVPAPSAKYAIINFDNAIPVYIVANHANVASTILPSKAMYQAFNNNTHVMSADFSNITELESQALYQCFYGCTKLASANVSTIQKIGDKSMQAAFRDTIVTTLSFNSLKPNFAGSYATQFNNMLSGVTGCTVHFPSNLQSVIGSWASTISGFSGTNTTVLFDLPATT